MPPSRAASTRPRVEGEREAEILDAALEVLAEVGYDRLTMDAVAAAGQGLQGHPLPPLERQGPASSSTRCMRAKQRHRTVEPVDTGIAARRPDRRLLRRRRPRPTTRGRRLRRDPHRDRPRPRVRRGVPRATFIAPKLAGSSAPSSSAPTSAARSAPTSTSSSSPRPSPGSCCTASSCMGEPPTESSSTASSTRSSSRPSHPARPPRPITSRPAQRDMNRMTDTDRRRRSPDDGAAAHRRHAPPRAGPWC